MKRTITTKRGNYSSLLSVLLLIFINLSYIILTYFIFFHKDLVNILNHPEYASESGSGMVGLAYWMWSIWLSPFVIIASLATYYLISRVFALNKLPIFTAIAVTAVISFVAANWVPIYSNIIVIKQATKYVGINLEPQLVDEKIEEVNNTAGDKFYPGVNPNKYVYRFTIDVQNPSNKAYPQFYIDAAIVYQRKSTSCPDDFCNLLVYDAPTVTYDSSPGHHLISSSFPVVFYPNSLISPSSNMKLRVIIYNYDGIWRKTYYLPSQIKNWMEIYINQREFIKLYQRK